MKDPLEHVDLKIRQLLIGGVVFVVAAIALAIANPTLAGTIGVVLFFFVVMIGLHELGHFVMAKRAGMKVTEFFIGFGPRLWSVTRGETEYGLKALPLGGYCKIVGMTNLEDVDPVDEARAFRAKGWWAKVSTVVAGPVTHFALAIMFVYAILVGGGDRHAAATTLTVGEVTTELAQLDADGNQVGTVPSAADEAGIEPGDTIVSLDGEEPPSWDALTTEFRSRPGETMTLTVDRDGELLDLTVTITEVWRDDATDRLAVDEFDGGERGGFVGLSPVIDIPEVGWFEAMHLAPTRSVQGAVETVGALGHMFSPAGVGEYLDNFSASEEEQSDTRFISPVGFSRVASDAVRAGWISVFGLLASINLFVGLLNLLPLLPFDGGHIAVASYEAIASKVRRRPVRVDFARLIPVMVATLSVLAFIFASSLFLDIARPPDVGF